MSALHRPVRERRALQDCRGKKIASSGGEGAVITDALPRHPEALFALSFDGRIPQGTVEFHDAFKADGPQEASG